MSPNSCRKVGSRIPKHSATARGLPGMFTIRQSPWNPATAREIIANGVVR